MGTAVSRTNAEHSPQPQADDQTFPTGRWVWADAAAPNQYLLFVKRLELSAPPGPLTIRVAASTSYELYIDGQLVGRGPIHGDPRWCLYDELSYTPPAEARQIQVAALAHHSTGTRIMALLPAPGGLRVEISGPGLRAGSDATWRCLDLPMWAQGVAERGWALDYCEDYDAALEPPGWEGMIFDERVTAGWPPAREIASPELIWGGYTARPLPALGRRLVEPARFTAYRAAGPGAAEVGAVSQTCDEEPLEPVAANLPYDLAELNRLIAAGCNAFTLDLGAEHIGFYLCELEAPAGLTVELSGAELLRPHPPAPSPIEGEGESSPSERDPHPSPDQGEGLGERGTSTRPWIFRKNTRYSARFRTRPGRQTLRPFGWSGFRYLHVVLRGDAGGARLLRAGCLERRADLPPAPPCPSDDPELRRIYELCARTLAISAQEHLIDCPTREQAQYWGDGVFIAESLWRGFGEPRYLEWYLECFLRAPLNPIGQLSCVYPGEHQTMLDYSLIPLIGQRFYRAHTGAFYKPAASCARALQLKEWYDSRRDARGLIQAQAMEQIGGVSVVNFIDHPGIGWHDFPHPGIDREGRSCPLNLFYYGFLGTLAEMLEAHDPGQAAAVRRQAADLGAAIVEQFFDGEVFRDARRGEQLSAGSSWQTNALAVYFGLARGGRAGAAMRAMLAGYDRLCRCSPYFHFFFLPALGMAGLADEARELIKREWRPMLAAGATTTWEGFLGDAKDSLCHPWSTAPFLFLLTGAGRLKPPAT